MIHDNDNIQAVTAIARKYCPNQVTRNDNVGDQATYREKSCKTVSYPGMDDIVSLDDTG